jgi:drug/metabolite transporter (DMT)-like permease
MTTENKERIFGSGLIALSAAAFGAMPIFTRAAYASGANVSGVLLVRFALAGAVLALVMIATGRSFPRGRELLVAVAMGGVGYVGQALGYFTALQHASAGLVALLLYLYPVLVSLLAAVFLGEHLTWRKAALLAVSFGGTALTIGSGTGTPLGIVLGVAAAVIYSIYITVGGRFLGRADSVGVSAVVCLSAAAVIGLGAGLSPPVFPADTAGWMALAAVALVSTVVAILSFFAGLRRVGASRAAILSTLEPVVTIGLAAWLLSEPILPLQAAGGAMILVAAILVARNPQ